MSRETRGGGAERGGVGGLLMLLILTLASSALSRCGGENMGLLKGEGGHLAGRYARGSTEESCLVLLSERLLGVVLVVAVSKSIARNMKRGRAAAILT